MAWNPTGGTILFKTVVPNVNLTTGGGGTANVYNIMTRDGTVFNAGAGANTFPAGLDQNQYLFDCSKYDIIRVSVQASALTGVVGANIGLFNLFPQAPELPAPVGIATPFNMQYFWAPGVSAFVTECAFSPNIAQTQASGSVAITNQVTIGGRLGVCFVAFFATTMPTAGNPVFFTVQGF